MVLVLALLSPFYPLAAAPTGEGVGRIVFAIGPVSVETGDSVREIARGARVYEGDRVTTGRGGNAQIRFVDGGFLGLKPQSAVRIHVYRPGDDGAGEVRIRLDVDEGAVRSITGSGGERDADGFRLNTPVAAVGVRGTDFTVRANQQRTRVRVHAGGVRVSPYTAECMRGGLGACAGGAARTLFASAVNERVLEVVRGAGRARIISQESASSGSRKRVEEAPSGDAEGDSAGEQDAAAGADTAAGGGQSQDVGQPQDLDQANGAGLSEPGGNADSDADVESAISDVDGSRAAGATIEDARFEAVRDDITWGRWSRVAGDAETVTDKRRDDQRPVALNRVFGLLAPRWPGAAGFDLPDSGVVAFEQGSADAVLLRGVETSAARVANPELSIDFARRLFRTSLDVQSQQLQTPAHVSATGSVDEAGRMRSDPGRSNATVNGVVGPEGRQAGMLFERRLDGGVIASGAIDWFR